MHEHIIPNIRLTAGGVRSLAWEGDDLIDWADGGSRYSLDGNSMGRLVVYAYPFDAVATLADSAWTVIYTRLGTKGLVLHRGTIVREINRSFYHANAYEYPVALGRLASGREVLVHCPDDYNRLEIDDLATGERLTASDQRKSSDIFHSRLAVSADGRHLLSAGWLWHPIDDLRLYDLSTALDDVHHLDGKGISGAAWADHSAATFLPDGRVAMWLMGDINGEDTPLQTGELRIADATTPSNSHSISPVGRLGTLLAADNDHVLALHTCPRLIELTHGQVLRDWPDVASGEQKSSILINQRAPVVAMDATHRRCAFADDEGITVIRW